VGLRPSGFDALTALGVVQTYPALAGFGITCATRAAAPIVTALQK
jgi:hypothetical protein